MSAPSPNGDVLSDLVDANHILFKQGVVDAFGHVSVRDPRQADRFWLSRSKAPALVSSDDLMCFDLEGLSEGDERSPYLERFIHSEIYRTRSDVMAVLHSHSPASIPFGVVNIPLRPVCHTCGFLTGRTPVFEIREYAASGSDLLIRNGVLGRALARCLGDKNVVLMRGHGLTVVGLNLRQVVFRGVYTELNARVQAQALSLSQSVTYLTDEEAMAIDATNQAQLGRAWDLWMRDL
ncbi:MAG: class II aldolase/adducin family protein [Chloroflexota bacterium]|nr:class II aldolase/adducin family protein [Chloroflexota bacterium]